MTVVYIVLILCATFVLTQIIRAVSVASSRKEVTKNVDRFHRAFGVKDKSKDDRPKFGGF